MLTERVVWRNWRIFKENRRETSFVVSDSLQIGSELIHKWE